MNTESLKKNYEFKNVYKRGQSVVGRYLVVYYLKNRQGFNRLGLTASKKVGNSVVRNRTRRLIKENFRQIESHLSQGYDIVIVARVSSGHASYYDIQSNLKKLLKVLLVER
ncbi:MAG: ribonuclease P protein component [Clostridiales bacterium]|nr:ribonuclease P protein component [Clostridiales bacterium]